MKLTDWKVVNTAVVPTVCRVLKLSIKKYVQPIVATQIGSSLCFPDELCNLTQTEISWIISFLTQEKLNQMYPYQAQ